MAVVALAVGWVAVVPGGASGVPQRQPAADVTVTLDRSTLSVAAGEGFRLRSTVRNTGPGTATGLLAHLELASSTRDVYVDPEDWSAQRTRYLRPLPPGGSVDLAWDVTAVGAGELLVLVSVADEAGAGAVVSGTPLRLTVTQQTSLDRRGALPVAATVPAVVLVLWGLVARRRRRLR